MISSDREQPVIYLSFFSNEDTGDKLESTLILIERWESFTSETKRVGGDKIREVQAEVDTLIEGTGERAIFKSRSIS